MFVLRSLLFPYKGARASTLSSECKIDQADFTDWITFLLSNLLEEICPNPEALSINT